MITVAMSYAAPGVVTMVSLIVLGLLAEAITSAVRHRRQRRRPPSTAAADGFSLDGISEGNRAAFEAELRSLCAEMGQPGWQEHSEGTNQS